MCQESGDLIVGSMSGLVLLISSCLQSWAQAQAQAQAQRRVQRLACAAGISSDVDRLPVSMTNTKCPIACMCAIN